jgi:hypothetical protein
VAHFGKTITKNKRTTVRGIIDGNQQSNGNDHADDNSTDKNNEVFFTFENDDAVPRIDPDFDDIDNENDSECKQPQDHLDRRHFPI